MEWLDFDSAERFRVVVMSEVPPPPPEVIRYKEMAYRRGYYQGFFDALDAVELHPKKSVIGHLYGSLRKWRFEQDLGVETFPPRLWERPRG